MTASLKLTWIEIAEPALYDPLTVDDVTPVTVGAVVSTVKLRVPLYDDPAADESTFFACQ